MDVFFVLSGFILTYVYYHKFFINTLTLRDYWNFVVKRFAKIYPLHFIITLIFIPVAYIAKYAFHQESLKIYPDTLLQNFLMMTRLWMAILALYFLGRSLVPSIRLPLMEVFRDAE